MGNGLCTWVCKGAFAHGWGCFARGFARGLCSECARTTLHVGVCKAECARLRVPAGGQRFGVAHLPLGVHLLSVQRFAHTQVCKSPYPRANTRLANAQQHRNPGAKLHIHVQMPLAHSHTPTCKHASVQKPISMCKHPLHAHNSTETLVQNSRSAFKQPLHTCTHPTPHTEVCKTSHSRANTPCTLTHVHTHTSVQSPHIYLQTPLAQSRVQTVVQPPPSTCKHPLHTHTHPQVWGGFSR